MWALLRDFSTTKYFEAAKAGLLDGQPPFTFGAIFALRNSNAADERTIFGDADVGVDGFNLGHGTINVGDQVIARSGTVVGVSGSDDNDATAVADADGTYAATPEANLINRGKAYLDPLAAIGGNFVWPSPRAMQLLYVAVAVPAAGNMTVICNGKIVSQQAVGNVVNANPIRIGIDSTGALPFDDGLLAGCFYHSDDLFGSSIRTLAEHWQECQRAQDLVNFGSYLSPAVTSIDYLWSVKRSRLWDGRTTWASDGAQASIDMVKQGATPLDVAGANSDVLAADLDWMTV